MSEHIGDRAKVTHSAAVGGVLSVGTVRTLNLDGQASTTEFTEAICRGPNVAP